MLLDEGLQMPAPLTRRRALRREESPAPVGPGPVYAAAPLGYAHPRRQEERLLRRGVHIFAASAVLLLAAPRPGLTQPAAATPPSAAQLSAARQLFGEALEAEDRGDWKGALERYERISKITVSPTLYFHLGTCHQALGNIVEAINAFELASQEAQKKRDREVAKESKAQLDKLRPKVAFLTLEILPAGLDDVSISLDGMPIRAALAGTAMPINPGKRRLVVRSETHEKVVELDVDATAGGASTITADLGAKKVVAPPPPLVVVLPPPPPKVIVAPPPPPDRLPAYLVGGGAVALGVGALATGLLAHSKYLTYIEQNADPARYPRAQRVELRDSGQTLALVSTALTVGAVLAGGVSIYFFTSPPGGARPAKAALSPWVGPEGAGLTLSGDL